MIGNIEVTVAVRTGGRLGREGGGGEIHGPEHHSGCVEVDTPGGEDAIDLDLVADKVAARLRHTPAEYNGAATRASHVVEAGAGVEMVTTAGTAANGGTPAVAAVGEDVATSTND